MSAVIYPTSNLMHKANLTVAKGQGVYIYDDQGKQYLEAMSGLWCTSLGYNNQELIDAATAQMGQLSYAHMFGGKTHQVGIDLADQLSAMVPVKNAKIFFGNSGSDANDTLIKILRYYHNAIGQPQKYKIIARQRSYHGVTVASACLTGLSVNHQHFDLPTETLGILRTDAPHYYHGALEGESEAEFVTRITDNLEQLIIEQGPDTIAAFIAEPVTGASGVIVPPNGYYQRVQQILNKYNILFWADEVITAFGRLGKDFGSNAMGIKSPDLMTLAKQLSSGYMPVSASVISGDIYQALLEPSNEVGVFGHGYTYSGHPCACAVALKTIEIYQRDKLFARAEDYGHYLHSQLNTLADHPLVGEIRGKGMIAAVELVADKTSKKPFINSDVAQYAMQSCQQLGMITRLIAGSSLAFCPPLIIEKQQIDEMIMILTTALDQTLIFAHKHNYY